MKIPLEISARHIHLCQKDLEILFGKNYQLTKLKDLSQIGQFAAQETVKLVGPKGEINRIRVIGPQRSQTQIEISKTDGFILGIAPPVRLSGNISGTPEAKIIGPKGQIGLKEGVIVAKRHLHISPAEAKNLKVKQGDLVSIKTEGERGLIFNNIVVRVDKNFRLACQLDTDEGNAAGIKPGEFGWLLKP